jgi:hypothetical protein
MILCFGDARRVIRLRTCDEIAAFIIVPEDDKIEVVNLYDS